MSQSWYYKNPLPVLPVLDSKVFIALLGLEDLPPHVAFIHENTMLSLNAQGVEIHSDAARVIRKLWSKRQCALVECEYNLELDATKNLYSSFEALSPGKSCIDPIRKIMEVQCNIIPEQPFLHGLLQALFNASLIRNCYVSFDCANVFELKPYSQEMIDERIERMKRVR